MSFQPLITASPMLSSSLPTSSPRAQARKGTAIPYVSHLLAVASIALELERTRTSDRCRPS